MRPCARYVRRRCCWARLHIACLTNMSSTSIPLISALASAFLRRSVGVCTCAGKVVRACACGRACVRAGVRACACVCVCVSARVSVCVCVDLCTRARVPSGRHGSGTLTDVALGDSDTHEAGDDDGAVGGDGRRPAQHGSRLLRLPDVEVDLCGVCVCVSLCVCVCARARVCMCV